MTIHDTAAGRATRRHVLGGTAAMAALSPLPSGSRARAASAPLSFWQFYAPGGAVASQAKWFETTVKAWNDTHDVKVELTFVPNAEYMNGSKLPTAFASGSGPDIFIISPGDFLRYYNGGALLDLTPFVEEKARRDFVPEIMATRLVDQKIYGIPMEFEPMAMYYSRAAFKDAGLGEADIPTSWQQLLALAKKLTNDRRFGVLFETTPGYYQNFTWYPFLWQGGGEMVGANGRSVFDSKAAAQALRFWQDAIKTGVAPRKPLGGGAWDIVPNLGSGFCAMQNCGIWGVSALRGAVPNFDYGVFKLPLPPGGKYVTVGGGWAFVANARGRNPEAAGRFCAWALGSMDAACIQRVVDWCTKAKSDIPPRHSAVERATAEKAFSAGPLKTFAEQIFPGARGEPRVPPQVYKVVSDAIQACQLGGQDPGRQAQLASQQLDAFLAGYHGAPII